MSQGAVRGGDFRFPKLYRLTKTDEYSSVFGFRRAIRAGDFLLHYVPRQSAPDNTVLLPPRLGLVIGKKFLRRAVHRNLVKRLGREIFRQQRASLPAYDLILRLTVRLQKPDRRKVAGEIRQLFDKLRRQGRYDLRQKADRQAGPVSSDAASAAPPVQTEINPTPVLVVPDAVVPDATVTALSSTS